MEDAELREAIMDCLPIGGPDRNTGYLDIGGDEVTEMINTLVAFVKEREQKAYNQGKEAFMIEMKQGLREDTMKKSELIEQLADKEHASWARWMDYLFSKCWKGGDGCLVIPETLVDQWQRQTDTPYAELSEQEKQSDRNEVAHILPIIDEYTGETHDETSTASS